MKRLPDVSDKAAMDRWQNRWERRLMRCPPGGALGRAIRLLRREGAVLRGELPR
jgi:hypothetical protein